MLLCCSAAGLQCCWAAGLLLHMVGFVTPTDHVRPALQLHDKANLVALPLIGTLVVAGLLGYIDTMIVSVQKTAAAAAVAAAAAAGALLCLPARPLATQSNPRASAPVPLPRAPPSPLSFLVPCLYHR